MSSFATWVHYSLCYGLFRWVNLMGIFRSSRLGQQSLIVLELQPYNGYCQATGGVCEIVGRWGVIIASSLSMQWPVHLVDEVSNNYSNVLEIVQCCEFCTFLVHTHRLVVWGFLWAASAVDAGAIFDLLGDIALLHNQCMHTCTARQEVPAITFTNKTLLIRHFNCSFTDHAYQRLPNEQQPMAGQQNPTQLQKSSKFKIKLIHTICVQKFLTRRTVYAYPCSILHCTVYKNQRLSIAEWKSHILTISRGPHISTTRSCSSKPALDSFIFRRNSRLYMWLYIQWAETNAHQIQSMNNHNVWTMNNGCM